MPSAGDTRRLQSHESASWQLTKFESQLKLGNISLGTDKRRINAGMVDDLEVYVRGGHL